MTEMLPVGLVTGSQPFAGLPTNPAELVLPFIEGMVVDGVRIVTRATPVSFAHLPSLLPELVRELKPAFVLALGLALGAPVVRAETVAINAAHFAMADNEGARPLGGLPFAPGEPQARVATWDAAAVVAALLDKGIPARPSFHAGTHLCNLTLYTYLGALQAAGSVAPCGFLHLPYLPEQVVWMMRQRAGRADVAPGTNLELPSMALVTQVEAVTTVVQALARQVRAGSSSNLAASP